MPGVDGPARLLARPADGDGARVVVVGTSLEDRDEAVAGLTGLLLVAGPIALAAAAVLGYLLAAAALRPVEAMRARAGEVSGAPAGARLPLPEARDELRRLGETLNAMLDRIDGALERERAFVADASHELRTPVAILKAEIDLALAGERSPQELRAALVSAREETERLARLADDLLVLARMDGGRLPLHPERLGTREVLDAVAARFAARAAEEGRTIEVVADPGASIVADRLRIEQAVTNLVDNALRHGAGPVVVRARRVGDDVELSVEDAGAGVPPEDAEGVFGRFVRGGSAAAGQGAGLGPVDRARDLARPRGRRAHRGDPAGRRGDHPPPGLRPAETGMPRARPRGARPRRAPHSRDLRPSPYSPSGPRSPPLPDVPRRLAREPRLERGLVAADRRERLADPSAHRQPGGRRRAGARHPGPGDPAVHRGRPARRPLRPARRRHLDLPAAGGRGRARWR